MAERDVFSLDQKRCPDGYMCVYGAHDEEFIRAKERSWNPSYSLPYTTAPKSGWRADDSLYTYTFSDKE